MCVALSGNLPALLLTVARALTLGCQEPFLRWLYDYRLPPGSLLLQKWLLGDCCPWRGWGTAGVVIPGPAPFRASGPLRSSPPPASPGLRGGRGHISAWPGVCPAPVPLDGLREAPNLPGRASRLGHRGATSGPALAQGATEAQKEDCVASGGCTYPDLAQHDHAPQPRKLNSRGLAADLDHGGHAGGLGALWRPLETS